MFGGYKRVTAASTTFTYRPLWYRRYGDTFNMSARTVCMICLCLALALSLCLSHSMCVCVNIAYITCMPSKGQLTSCCKLGRNCSPNECRLITVSTNVACVVPSRCFLRSVVQPHNEPLYITRPRSSTPFMPVTCACGHFVASLLFNRILEM